jgi:hypothetical protein
VARACVFVLPLIHIPTHNRSYSRKSIPLTTSNPTPHTISNTTVYPAQTTLCFVNSHLAAHEGHRAERDESVRSIIRHMAVGRRQLDFTAQADYTFWMGDLNYRERLASGAVCSQCGWS